MKIALKSSITVLALTWMIPQAYVIASQAASFRQAGSVAFLTGPIMAGDDRRFQDFLRRPDAARIRVLYLSSPGGMVYETYKMSQMVRAANLTTVVDASSSICASACTAIFSAGTRRYYVNARGIVDGSRRQSRGLGFHQASDWRGGDNGISRQNSYRGNVFLSYIYREMGVPRASTLTERANYDGIYFVSGPTALSLGLATGLNRP